MKYQHQLMSVGIPVKNEKNNCQIGHTNTVTPKKSFFAQINKSDVLLRLLGKVFHRPSISCPIFCS